MPDIFIASTKKRILSDAEKIIKNAGIQPTKNRFASFVALPDKITFETQDPEETIILLLRQHGIVNLGWILLVLVFIIVPLVLKSFPLLFFLPIRFKIIALILWYLFVLAFVYERYLSWFYNVYLVTDERLIDVDFLSLTYHKVTEAKIDKIQDITFKVGGFSKNFLNYGDVYIQTAGTSPELEFNNVPKPEVVVKVLNQLILQEEQEKIEGRVR